MKQIVLVFLLIFTYLQSSDTGIKPIYGIAGAYNDVVLGDGYSYVAGSNGLKIYEISNGSQKLIAQPWLPEVNALVKKDNILYLATCEGLFIFDVSDPHVPKLQSKFLDDNWCAKGIDIDNNDYLYISENKTGLSLQRHGKLLVFDVSDPHNPILRGSIQRDNYNYNRLKKRGNYLYITTNPGGLEVVNVMDPDNPAFVNDTSPFSLGDVAYDVEFTELSNVPYAIVANGENGVQIININNPDDLVITKTYNTSGIALDVSKPYYDSNHDRNVLFIADDSKGVVAIDITTPSNPILLGSDNTQFRNCTGVIIVDDGNGIKLLYTIFKEKELSVFRIVWGTDNKISNFSRFSSLNVHTTSNAWDAIRMGNKLYIAGNKLLVVDISKPGKMTPPQEAYNQITPYFELHDYQNSKKSIDIVNNHAYVSLMENGFDIIDINGVSRYSYVNQINTDGTTYDLQKVDSRLYVADGEKGLKVYEGDDNNLSLKGTFDANATVYSVSIHPESKLAFLSCGSSGLKIVSTADLNNIHEIASFNPSNENDYQSALIVKKTITEQHNGFFVSYQVYDIYIADDKFGLIIMRFNPFSQSLTQIGALNLKVYSTYDLLHQHPLGINNLSFITKNYLVASNHHGGMKIIDVNDPNTPKVVSTYYTKGSYNVLGVQKKVWDDHQLVPIDQIQTYTKLLFSMSGYNNGVSASYFVLPSFPSNGTLNQNETLIYHFKTTDKYTQNGLAVYLDKLSKNIDLYIGIDAIPTTSTYDFSSTNSGTKIEKISIPQPQEGSNVFILLKSRENNASFRLSIGMDYDGDGIPVMYDYDNDNDGISDYYEQKAGTDPYDSSSHPSDLDHDGIPDSYDSDRDGDGIPNTQESRYGLNPDNPSDGRADSDGDGFNNALEISIGTDIRNAASKPGWAPIVMGNIVTFVPFKP